MTPDPENEIMDFQPLDPDPESDAGEGSPGPESLDDIEDGPDTDPADLIDIALDDIIEEKTVRKPFRGIWDGIDKMIENGISFGGYSFDQVIDAESISMNFGADFESADEELQNTFHSLLEKENSQIWDKVEPDLYYLVDYLIMLQERDIKSAPRSKKNDEGVIGRKLREITSKLVQSKGLREAFFLGTNYKSELNFLSEMADLSFEDMMAAKFQNQSDNSQNEQSAKDFIFAQNKFRTVSQRFNNLIRKAATSDVAHTLERVDKKVRNLQVEKVWLEQRIGNEIAELEHRRQLDNQQRTRKKWETVHGEIAEIRKAVIRTGGKLAEELDVHKIASRRILTKSRAARAMMRIEEFDPKLYDNRIAMYKHVPYVLIFPYRGRPFMMLEKNLVVLPAFCPRPIERTLAHAFAIYRIKCDVNNRLRNSYSDAQTSQAFLKTGDFVNSFTNAYMEWVVNGTRMRSQLPPDIRRWFNQEIAPSTNNLIIPSWYKMKDLRDFNLRNNIDECNRQIKNNPEDAESYFKLGIILYLQNNLIAAANTNIQAIKADPQFSKAHYNLGLVLERLDLRQKAKKVWRNFLVVEKDSWWSLSARRHLAKLGGY
jgi:tetratricopeptide (TPR) repeat protein